MNETKALAQFVADIKYEDLSPQVIEKTKGLVLDQLGCEFAFATLPWNKAVYQYIKDKSGSGGISTIVYYGLKTTMEDAAFANAVFGHGFEMDDTEMHALTHPGSVVIPSALAAGEAKKASGKDFITAIVAGYDAMVRIAMASRTSIERGFHGTAVNGPFGSVAAASRILGINADTIVNALGIVASDAGGIAEYSISGGMVKRLHAGFAAQAGVRATLLAQNGLTGPATALEGKKGFCQAFANQCYLEEITAGLGKEFRIMWTGNKPYCCCAAQHTVIDATAAIIKEHLVKPEEIEKITVEQMPREVRTVGNIIEPQDITSAQFSGRFGVALRLIKGGNGFRDYTMENIKDPAILGLVHKIDYTGNEALEGKLVAAAPAIVTIKLKNGEVYKKRVDYAKGTTNNPLTIDELKEKFRGLTGPALSGERAEKIIEMLMELEELDDISRLIPLLTIKKRQSSESVF
jgi:2-methylcitrate dehydratase PrpD